MIICKCVDELHRTNKERENDEEREAAEGIVEKLVSVECDEYVYELIQLILDTIILLFSIWFFGSHY